MWIFLNDAYISIVEHSHDSRMLMVRARLKGDIGRALPGVKLKVSRTPDADYLYRAVVSRPAVAAALADAVMTRVNYSNFKNSVKDRPRHDAYLRVWNSMYQLQEDKRQPKRKPAPYLGHFPAMDDDDAREFERWALDRAVVGRGAR